MRCRVKSFTCKSFGQWIKDEPRFAGDTEGGLVGTTMHKATKSAFSGVDAKRVAALNAAIEKAVFEPAHVARLTAEMGKRTRYMSPARAFVQAIAAIAPASPSQ